MRCRCEFCLNAMTRRDFQLDSSTLQWMQGTHNRGNLTSAHVRQDQFRRATLTRATVIAIKAWATRMEIGRQPNSLPPNMRISFADSTPQNDEMIMRAKVRFTPSSGTTAPDKIICGINVASPRSLTSFSFLYFGSPGWRAAKPWARGRIGEM